MTIVRKICCTEWNLDLTKCQATGEICSLYRGFVIVEHLTSIYRIFWNFRVNYQNGSLYRGIILKLSVSVSEKIAVMTFQYRAILSYGTRNSRTGKTKLIKTQLYT